MATKERTSEVEALVGDLTAVRAPRGTQRSCKGWHQEAALRMLCNNLDPDVAEDPTRLIVYGGSGRAARSHDALRAIVRTLLELENDETMLVQSGKPVAVFKTYQGAPRVLIANSLLVPRFATWDEFRRLEAEGLTMFGQMTAGSWIYIGTQGILQGTYQTFAAAGETHWGSPDLAGHTVLTAGLGGMGGAQPLAASLCGATSLNVEVDPHRIERRLETRYLDEVADDLDDAVDRVRRYAADGHGDRRRARAPRLGPRRVRPPGARDGRPARPGDARPEGRREPRLRLRQQPSHRGPGCRPRACLRLSGLRSGLRPAALLPGRGPVPVGGALGRSGRHPSHRRRAARGVPRRCAPPAVAADGARPDRLPGAARSDLLARLRRPRPGGAALQRPRASRRG